MPSQSLTQHIPPPFVSAATQQFFNAQAVQQRLTAACAKYSAAAAALQKATEARDRFVNSGSKNGVSKQLPAKLDWKLSKTAHFSSDAVPAEFFASDRTTLRAIEREATEKAFDALLAAKEKHIAFLKQHSSVREFVNTAAAEFLSELKRIAADFDSRSQADANALSQAEFAYPLNAVAAYFNSELHKRLAALNIAAGEAKLLQEHRLAEQRSEEYKAQETVLTGAHTGQSIAFVAEQAIDKRLAPVFRQLEALSKQLPLHQSRPPPPAKQHSRHRAPPSDASSSQARQAPHHRNADRQRPPVVVTPKQKASKRDREVVFEDEAIEQNPSAPSHRHHQQGANKRHKLTVTLKSKNGEGGDRPPRSDQQQPRSSRPASAPHQNNARNQGRGPRSNKQQPQQHQ